MIKRHLEARKRAGEAGFTLIELLVVIVILAILAAVVVFAVGGIGDKGQGAACEIDERTLRTAEEAYAAQQADAANMEAGGGGLYIDQTTTDVVGSQTAGDLVPRFLSQAPKYHTVDASADRKDFTINVVAGAGCTP